MNTKTSLHLKMILIKISKKTNQPPVKNNITKKTTIADVFTNHSSEKIHQKLFNEYFIQYHSNVTFIQKKQKLLVV